MDFKGTLRYIREQWKMFWTLLPLVKPDCRLALIEEFFTKPDALRQRYQIETEYQSSRDRRWQNKREDV